jgi:hypothetical protein
MRNELVASEARGASSSRMQLTQVHLHINISPKKRTEMKVQVCSAYTVTRLSPLYSMLL